MLNELGKEELRELGVDKLGDQVSSLNQQLIFKVTNFAACNSPLHKASEWWRGAGI